MANSGMGGIFMTAAMVVVGGAAIYSIETGHLGEAPEAQDSDAEIAEVITAKAPESQADAWSARRDSPVRIYDDEVTEKSFYVEAPEVVELAWGWSQARAEPIPTVCIEYATDSRTAQSSDIKITEVRDSYSLAKAMNVSSSVSVKGVGYNVSGKASFAKNTNVSSSSVTYLVNAEVLNGAEYVRPSGGGAVRLTDEAAAMARQDLERFQAVCGEGFVSATISGARAYLLAETQTTSRSERQSVRASVKGSGWGVKVEAAVSGSSESGTENLTRNITFYQQGGAAIPEGTDAFEEAAKVTDAVEDEAPADGAADPIAAGVAGQASLPENAAQAIARIRQLPVAAATAGKIFELQVTPYQVLENFPRGADLLGPEDEHDEIAADWGAYQTLYADLKTVLENPGQYVMPIQNCAGTGDAATCVIEMVPLVQEFEINAEAIAMVEALQDMTLVAMNEIEIAAEICLVVEEDCNYDGSLVRSPYSVRASMPLLRDVEPAAGAYLGTIDQVRLYSDELKAVIDARTAQATAADVLATQTAGFPDDPETWNEAQKGVAAPLQDALARAQSNRAAVEAALADKMRSIAPHSEDHLIQHLREPALGRCVFGAATSGCISNAEIRGWAKRTGLANVVTTDAAATRSTLESCGIDARHILSGEADDPPGTVAPTLWFPARGLKCL